MDKNSNVKIGLIGCGGVSSGHVRHLLKIPDTEIVAVSDIAKPNIAWLKNRYPEISECQTFTNHKTMLKSVDLDGIEVLTPHTLHYDHIMDVLDASVDVLVEKSMVTSVKHAVRVADRAKKENKTVLVSYQRRYQSRFRYIKNIISSGLVGKVQFISALQSQPWLEGTKGKWRQNPKMSGGGQLMDTGSHLLDVILWLTELEPFEVFAFIDNLNTPVDINSSLSVRFKNGSQASIGVIGNSSSEGIREDITIWGKKGILFHRNVAEGNLYFISPDGKKHEPTVLPAESNPDINFINTIKGTEENMSPPEDSVNTTRLAQMAYESARFGKPLKVNSSGLE